MYFSISTFITSILTTAWLCNGGGWEATAALATSVLAYAGSEYRRYRSLGKNEIKEPKIIDDPSNKVSTAEARSNYEDRIKARLSTAEKTSLTPSKIVEKKNSLQGRFIELETFDEVESGKKISTQGYVQSVSKQRLDNEYILSLYLVDSPSKNPFTVTTFSLYLPKRLEKRVYALRIDDLISFEGILSLKHGITVAALDFKLINNSNKSVLTTPEAAPPAS